MKTVGFMLMVDNSYSMKEVMEQVKIDANAFVGDAWPKDQFGILKFNDHASWIYPAGTDPKIVTVSDKYVEIRAAEKAVAPLQCEGWYTNIGEAIRLSNQMYNQASTDVKAFVLISDGASNIGPDPVNELGKQPPIYIAALGNIYESYFLQMLKKNPASKYYHADKKEEMIKIFNEIRATAPNSILLSNDQQYYQHTGYQIVPATVCSDSGKVQFSVVWPHQAYKYTSGRPNGTNINVQLIDPQGRHRHDEPTIVGNGYCTFNLEDAQSGTWDILVNYDSIVSPNIYGTVGAFQLDTDTRVNIALPNVLTAGEPLPLDVELSRNGIPLENMKIQTTVKRPAISVDNALKKYAERLKDIRLEENQINPDIPEKIERLRLLHTQLLPQENILPVYSSFHSLSYSPKKGTYGNTFTETHEAGAYTVEVKVTGTDPKTGQPVTWLKSQSTIVK